MTPVLVADDSVLMTMFVSHKLRELQLGLCPIVVHDGEEAWETLQANPDISLAVLDWMMPGLSGPELCRRLRGHEAHALTYVILLTACDSPAHLVEGLDAGANDYLVKPFDYEEFRARINVGLRVVSLQDSLRERVTALDASAAQLRADMERYKLLVEGTHAIPWEIDARTFTFAYISPQASALLGYEADTIGPGASVWDFIHGDDHENVKEHLRRLASGEATEDPNLNFRMLTGNRGVLDVHSVVGVRGEPPNVVLRGILMDITKQKKLERELQQAQKLESVGRLAAGVAHEINTPVQFVSDSIHFVRDAINDLAPIIRQYQHLRQAVGASAPRELVAALETAEETADIEYVLENLPKSIDRSLDGLDRVATIVRSMKQFAHPDQKEMTAVDLNQAILSTLTIARNEYKYVADLDVDWGDLPLVTCYAGEINQVVLNIVVNAAHAIEDVVRDTGDKGRIGVATRRDGDQVVITISDTGGGISEDIRERIFDPFFTTKGVGKGTGQGLAIARSVVLEKHHGDLRFDTEIGKGTTFTIRLPIGAAA